MQFVARQPDDPRRAVGKSLLGHGQTKTAVVPAAQSGISRYVADKLASLPD
jgi:hypothetical protein